MMKNFDDHDSTGEPAPESSREETLISRIVDGEAFEDDWREFELGAQRDARAWERLARAQREHDRLARDVEDAIAIAELVDLPHASVHAFALTARIRQYSGWAVAAALSLALLAVMGVQVSGGGNRSAAGFNLTTALDDVAPETIYEHYIRRGRDEGIVVGEAQKILVQWSQAATGTGYDVVYVRQPIERQTLQEIQPFLETRNPETNEPSYVPLRRVAGRAY